MPMFYGSNRLSNLYWGSTAISRVYHGSTLVWRRPAAIVPLPIPDPLYHFDASFGTYSDADALTPATDGTGVARWSNRGTAEDALQGTEAIRPKLMTGGVNGLPYIQGDPVAGAYFEPLLADSQPSGLSTLNRRTIFVVAQFPDTTTQGGGTLFGTRDASDANGVDKSTFDFVSQSRVRYSKAEWIKVIEDTTPEALSIIGMGGLADSAPFYSYGTQGTYPQQFSDATNWDSSATSGFGFLRRYSTSPDYFRGKLYEVIFYDRALSLTEHNDVLNYLRSKYGLPTISNP